MTITADSAAEVRVLGRGARATWIALLLVLLTAALYARTVTFDFVNYDDDVYVYQNRHVQAGLSWEGVRWAFTTGDAGNWHPLTWISLQADVNILGGGAGAHHATSAAIHAFSAALLFLGLHRMTGALWPSAFCAAVFAWHPLRVESVAWIAERKDVLCGLFWMLALLAYAAYARRPGFWRYLGVVAATAGALLSKPMAVTLPFTLLLLDFWPLARGGTAWGWGVRVTEKLPLLAMSAASAVVTVWAQKRGGAITGESLGIGDRIKTAIYAVGQYLADTVWPSGLAPFYPHPQQPPLAGLSATTLAVATGVFVVMVALALFSLRRRPWVSMGIFWFLGTLVPVIGLVQVGMQSHADRYTYIPSIGLGIAVAWTLADWGRRQPAMRGPVGSVAVLALAALAVTTVRQIGHWSDSVTLWRHTIAVVPDNYIAHNNLAHALHRRGDRAGAIEHFTRAVEIHPDYARALHNLGVMLGEAGRDDEAIIYLERALRADSAHEPTYAAIERVQQRRGQPNAALRAYEALLSRDPMNVPALHGIAAIRARQGQLPVAIDTWRKLLAIDPNHADARHSLGLALVLTGSPVEGVEHLRAAERLDPHRVETLTWLAWTLASSHDASVRNPPEAVAFARRAVSKATGRSLVTALDTLAAAKASTGDFESARQTIRQAIQSAMQDGYLDLLDDLRSRQALYDLGRAYVQPLP